MHGQNYTEHIIRWVVGARDPVIFLKPNTAIIGPNVAIQLPEHASRTSRGRIAAVIRRPCKERVRREAAENILRLHDRQRCVGARPAEGRRAMDAG